MQELLDSANYGTSINGGNSQKVISKCKTLANINANTAVDMQNKIGGDDII